jgi:hypothetical protein
MALAQGLIPLVAGVGTALVGLTLPFIAGAALIVTAWSIVWRME